MKSTSSKVPETQASITRRRFLLLGSGGLAAATAGPWLVNHEMWLPDSDVFIAKAASYQVDLMKVLTDGFRELGVANAEIRDKVILLKPNLVEPHSNISHINTHPLFVRACVEFFLSQGAREVIVAEAPGHRRDTLLVLEESGLEEALKGVRAKFRDMNDGFANAHVNLGRATNMSHLFLPQLLDQVDWVVSIAKMKTHHWTGATLTMKNLFGVMPGNYYGWPKNVLHHAGIHPSIYDINSTVRPHFGIVDGIVGMEGDGPIMGTAKEMGVVVMGRNLPSVDATCARVMGINPKKIGYLRLASRKIAPIGEKKIHQRGEKIADVRKDFLLFDWIKAQQGLRLG